MQVTKKVHKRTRTTEETLPTDYVSNKGLLEQLKQYKVIYNEAKKNDQPTPPLNDYIGRCILMIATKLANKSNFAGYSFKQEMICDGIENCIKYLHNFNPDKYDNPFAYITQIVKFAFIRRIKTEEIQQYYKMKGMQDYQLMEQLNDNTFLVDHNDVAAEFIKEFEAKIKQKKKPKPKALGTLLSDDE